MVVMAGGGLPGGAQVDQKSVASCTKDPIAIQQHLLLIFYPLYDLALNDPSRRARAADHQADKDAFFTSPSHACQGTFIHYLP